jgi:HlyD family secretion protein
MKYFVAGIAVLATAVLVGWIAHSFFGVPIPLVGAGGSESEESPMGRATGDESDSSRPVVALGWLEPADGVIDVGAPTGDRLEALLVSEGSLVEEGQVLGHLESRNLRQIEVASIESQIQEAEARLVAETKLADARIVTAELGIEKADMQEMDARSLEKKIELLRANLTLAQKDLARLSNLSDELVSDQELERQSLVARQAEAELGAAELELEKLSRTREFSAKAARAELEAADASKEQVLAAIPVESLKSQLAMAEIQLAQTEIVAPAQGSILKVFTNPGEPVGRTPILQMANLERMVAVAEVYETDVKRIRVGQPAIVISQAFPSPYDEEGVKGKVLGIAKLITTPELKSLDPFARTDRDVLAVRIQLDEEGSRQAADYVNLQVEVKFDVSDAEDSGAANAATPD